jgi:molybdopterin converting factor small subunit
MNRFTLLALAIALGTTGCEKKEETSPMLEEPALNTAKNAEPATPATTAQQEQAAAEEIDDGLQLEQDVEERAYEQVTLDNVDQELDKLEKEIKEAEKIALSAPKSGGASGASAGGATKSGTAAGGATKSSGAAATGGGKTAPGSATP